MYRIGIDLGGTNIAVGIVTEEGKIVSQTSTPTMAERPFDQIIADMAKCIHKLLKENNLTAENLASIGIGTPGCIDTSKGMLLFANNFAYGKNINFRTELQKYFNLPVYIGNDANVAALGEVKVGSAKNVQNAIMITLGTGVGGGIIINGQIYEGQYSAAGELGHIVLVKDGEQCSCGRKGCWEAYASVTALIRQTKSAIRIHPESLVAECGQDKVSGRTAFEAARQGDKIGLYLVQRYCEYIAEGLTDIINIFRPEVIILGGGISKEGEFLLDPIRDYLRVNAYGNGMLPEQKIVTATLGNDAGLIGAALLDA